MKKSFKRIISIFTIISMLLACSPVVFAADVTVTSSVANDGYLKVGDDVVLTFSEAITEENAANITVTKVGDDTNTNVVTNVAVDDTKVTLGFGEDFEYSTSYKITVPAGVVTNEFTSYFTTYNKFFRGINKVIVDENFNSMTADAVPAYKTMQDSDDIGKFTVGTATTATSFSDTDINNISIASVENFYGQNNNAIKVTTAKGGNKVELYLENYNNRIYDKNQAKFVVDGIVISFKFKASPKMNDYRITLNGSKRIFKYLSDSADGAKHLYTYKSRSDDTLFSTNFNSDWHEYTAEYKFNDNDISLVYGAVDGEIVGSGDSKWQNIQTNLTGDNFRSITIALQEWTLTDNVSVLFDDIKIYEPTPLLATTTAKGEAKTAQTFITSYVNFSNPVDSISARNNIKVADEDGNIIDNVQIKVHNNLKNVAIWMPTLEPNSKYTITVPDTVKDIYGNPVAALTYDEYTLGVENPQFIVGNPSIDGTVAAGNTITASAALTENTTSSDKNVTLVVVLYNGIKAVAIDSVTQVFEKNAKNEEITASITVPSDIELKNYEVRAFLLDDNLNSIGNTAKTEK